MYTAVLLAEALVIYLLACCCVGAWLDRRDRA